MFNKKETRNFFSCPLPAGHLDRTSEPDIHGPGGHPNEWNPSEIWLLKFQLIQNCNNTFRIGWEKKLSKCRKWNFWIEVIVLGSFAGAKPVKWNCRCGCRVKLWSAGASWTEFYSISSWRKFPRFGLGRCKLDSLLYAYFPSPQSATIETLAEQKRTMKLRSENCLDGCFASSSQS